MYNSPRTFSLRNGFSLGDRKVTVLDVPASTKELFVLRLALAVARLFIATTCRARFTNSTIRRNNSETITRISNPTLLFVYFSCIFEKKKKINFVSSSRRSIPRWTIGRYKFFIFIRGHRNSYLLCIFSFVKRFYSIRCYLTGRFHSGLLAAIHFSFLSKCSEILYIMYFFICKKGHFVLLSYKSALRGTYVNKGSAQLITFWKVILIGFINWSMKKQHFQNVVDYTDLCDRIVYLW